jgi:translation initiation factor 4E
MQVLAMRVRSTGAVLLVALSPIVPLRRGSAVPSATGGRESSQSTLFPPRCPLFQVMGLPVDAVMEYKKHTDSMRDNSSYRNANPNFL